MRLFFVTFENEYKNRLKNLLSYIETNRRLTSSMTRDLLDSIEPELFYRCFSLASRYPCDSYPELEGDNWPYTNQALLYIGYLRGLVDGIDSVSSYIPVGDVVEGVDAYIGWSDSDEQS